MAQKILQFFSRDIWRIRSKQLSGFKGGALRSVRILIISIREFASDKCMLRASALTFFSLLSIVPVLAMAFGVAKGFGLDKMLRKKLIENMEGQQEVITRAIEFSENMLKNTSGGVVAGIGLLFLFWTVIKVLNNIETSFNDIWGVKKSRSWGRKFTDYLALMMIAPIAFLVGSSISVFVVSQIQNLTEKITFLGMFGPLILTALKVFPMTVFWGLLTYLYIFLPNTRIQFKSALIGGVVAGTLYQVVQWGYFYFQIGVSSAGAVYGSFAALPLFLMWLQISWLIVLFGAEIAFAHQNEQTFEFEPDCLNASYETRKLIALRIVQLCVARFRAGLPAMSAAEIATEIETPIRLTREILHHLTQAQILSILQGDDEKDRKYQPARDISEMTIQFVIEQMEKSGSGAIPIAETPELKSLQDALYSFYRNNQELAENKLL